MRYVYFMVIFLFFLGCSSRDGSIGFADDELVDILAELHIAEAAVLSASKDSMELKRKQYKRKIAQKYNITEQEIDKGVTALQDNQDKLKEIYSQVVTRLKEREDSIKIK